MPVTLPVPVTVMPVSAGEEAPVAVRTAAAGTAAPATLGRAEPMRYAASSATVTSRVTATVRPFTWMVMPL